MSPEAQRIAIANAYLLEYMPDGDMVCCRRTDFENLQESPAGFGRTEELSVMDLLEHYPEAIPDYLNDLNAMREAERGLFSHNAERYVRKLHVVVACGSANYAEFYGIHATAAQRAEAFLKTLNLWKD